MTCATSRPAQLYALAASRTFGRRVCRVRFIYLAEPCEIEWRLEPEDLARAEQQLRRRVTEILEDQELRATPGFHCRWCPYAPICDARDETPAELDAEAGDEAETEVPF